MCTFRLHLFVIHKLDLNIFVVIYYIRSEFEPTTSWSSDVHSLPDAGAGEGVQVQSVLDKTKTS